MWLTGLLRSGPAVAYCVQNWKLGIVDRSLKAQLNLICSEAVKQVIGPELHMPKYALLLRLLTWPKQLALLRCPEPFLGVVAHLSRLHDL